ncbi:MAG: MerR family transcriptional regulator [Agathobacter sp.]|nr:MerR family transcriptional regulator [Agathobacter sp.]
MTIKEVEEQLGLQRATIRFYERENLLTPQRGGNTYREYSEDDIAVLKKIIILRKLGFSVSEIKDFLEENVPLQDLLEKNVQELQEKMNELNGAIKICKKMQSRQEDFESFNENFYWEEIKEQEQAGNKFLEIVNDTIKVEKNILLEWFNIADGKGNLIKDRKEIVFNVVSAFLIYAIVWYVLQGLAGNWDIEYFFMGLLQPVFMIIAYSIWEVPLFFIAKKWPKAAKLIRKIGTGIVIILIALLALILIFGEPVSV